MVLIYTRGGSVSWGLLSGILFHFWSLHWQTLSFPSEASQNCSKSCRQLQSHLAIACEQKGPGSSACHPSHASLPVPTASHPAHTSSQPHFSRAPHTGLGPASPPCPRQSQLIRHTCWGFSSFIIPKAALACLGPRHKKSELVFKFAMDSLHEIREDSLALCVSVACLRCRHHGLSSHPLSVGASASGDRGFFYVPPQ